MGKCIKIIEYDDSVPLILPEDVAVMREESWREVPVPAGYVNIVLSYSGDDEVPLCHKEKGLSDALASRVSAEGVVTGVKVKYPRADRYGVPLSLSGVASFSKGLAGYCGFAVTTAAIEAEGEDTQDDSGESYEFTMAVPPDLAEAIEKN
jgi:hypothetical protein